MFKSLRIFKATVVGIGLVVTALSSVVRSGSASGSASRSASGLASGWAGGPAGGLAGMSSL
jgi:hypothetical protein